MACSHDNDCRYISELPVTTIQECLLLYTPKKCVVHLQEMQMALSEPLRVERDVESSGLLGYMFKYAMGEMSIVWSEFRVFRSEN